MSITATQETTQSYLLANPKITPRVTHEQALSRLVYEIRDPQTYAGRFRQALQKIGEYLALGILEQLDTTEVSIQTLTGKKATHHLVQQTPVLVTILRAGLPLNEGVLNVFPDAKVGFLAMSRNEETLQASVDYIALPKIEDECVIITDTMLATGGSLLNAIRIIEKEKPKQIFVVAALASKIGIECIFQHNPKIQIFAAAEDPSLSEKGYILPGLGDAGDRSYGKKHVILGAGS